jgi:hypothetical protein
VRLLRIFLVVAALAWAEDDADTRKARERLGLTASRAIALFHSADSIAANLEARGATLHPELIAMRVNIERLLDRAEAAIDKGDRKAAGRDLDRAEGFLTRFSKRIGG